MDKLFPVREKSGNFVQTRKVREIWTKYWKSQGNLENLFFVLFLIELYLLKWIKFSGPPGGCSQWLSNLGKAGVPQLVPVVLVQIVYWVYC